MEGRKERGEGRKREGVGGERKGLVSWEGGRTGRGGIRCAGGR